MTISMVYINKNETEINQNDKEKKNGLLHQKTFQKKAKKCE